MHRAENALACKYGLFEDRLPERGILVPGLPEPATR